MKSHILNQLLKKRSTDNPYLDYFDKKVQKDDELNLAKQASPSKFKDRKIQLLFLRIFKEVRKKLRKGNQFDVAREIKRIFIEAKSEHVFEYLHKNEWQINRDTWLYEFVPLADERYEREKAAQDLKRTNLFKKLGLRMRSCEYLYGYFFSDELVEYYVNATPAAIVQMKKRLEKLKG